MATTRLIYTLNPNPYPPTLEGVLDGFRVPQEGGRGGAPPPGPHLHGRFGRWPKRSLLMLLAKNGLPSPLVLMARSGVKEAQPSFTLSSAFYVLFVGVLGAQAPSPRGVPWPSPTLSSQWSCKVSSHQGLDTAKRKLKAARPFFSPLVLLANSGVKEGRAALHAHCRLARTRLRTSRLCGSVCSDR